VEVKVVVHFCGHRRRCAADARWRRHGPLPQKTPTPRIVVNPGRWRCFVGKSYLRSLGRGALFDQTHL
jgi:hypothetical protein